MNTLPIDFVLLIPCYNNQKELANSLHSISYPPAKFEVLVIDDGSKIPIREEELLQQFSGLTIRVIRLEKNAGIVNALNTGLRALKSRKDVNYIARLDAGDLASEQRFYKQVTYLDTHKEITLLASWARFEPIQGGKGYDYVTQTTHDEILKEMHYKCSFIHPAVMFRKKVLDTIGFYPDTYPHAEDYAFFWSILKSCKGAVLPEKLVRIGFSDKNVSAENYKQQLRSRKKVVKTYGDKWLHKLLGVGMLNLKGLLPQQLIRIIKSF